MKSYSCKKEPWGDINPVHILVWLLIVEIKGLGQGPDTRDKSNKPIINTPQC